MKTRPFAASLAVRWVMLVVLATASHSYAAPAEHVQPNPIVVAQAPDNRPRELEPRYQPVPPQQQSRYNSDYLFGLTRGVADSTMAPGAKVLLFPLTVPLDLALLPFEVIGGLF